MNKSILKRARSLFAVAAIVLAIVLSMQGSAEAHDVSVNGAYDCGFFHTSLCSHGGVQRIHTEVYACDDFADGLGAFTIYWLYSGFEGQVHDGNGSAAGCGDSIVTGTDNPVWYIQSCISDPPVIICGARVAA
jgi:hypothetical protein